MRMNMKWFVVLTALLMVLSSTAMMAMANKGGGGKGGGPPRSDMGDLYGDLVEIYREPANGVPYLDENSCEILISATDGSLIYMIYDQDSNSCTIPEDADVIEVSFGRLNAVRAPPHVLIAAFDEAINALNAASEITLDDGGRFLLNRTAVDAEGNPYYYWKAIDSPRENLALYKKLMTDGHLEGNLGDDPYANVGDPAAEPVLRPVLDVAHFQAVADANIFDHLVNNSAGPQDLPPTEEDLESGAYFMAAAGDKTGHITADLVFNLNSIMGLNTKNESGFYDQSTVVNFHLFDMDRSKYEKSVYVLVPELNETGAWIFGHWVEAYIELMNYSKWPESTYNGSNPDVFTWDIEEGWAFENEDIGGFAQASDDALRVIAYIHDQRVPPAPVDIPYTATWQHKYQYKYRNWNR